MLARRLLICLLALPLLATGQHLSVRGQVTDAQSRESLPYVRVAIASTAAAPVGTITDAEGRFQLAGLAPADTLVFRCLGYEVERLSAGQLLARGGRVQLSPSALLLPTVELMAPRLTAREIVARALRRWASNVHTGYRAPRLVQWADWVRVDSLSAQHEGISAYTDSGYFYPAEALQSLTLESRRDTGYASLAARYADHQQASGKPERIIGVQAVPPIHDRRDLAAYLLRGFDPFRQLSQSAPPASPVRLLLELDLNASWLAAHTFTFDGWVSLPQATEPLARIRYQRRDTLYALGRDKPVLTSGHLLIDPRRFRVYEIDHRVQWMYLDTWMTFAQLQVRYVPDPALRGRLRIDRIERGYELLLAYPHQAPQRKLRVLSVRVLGATLPPKTFAALAARPRPAPHIGPAPVAWPWSLVTAD